MIIPFLVNFNQFLNVTLMMFWSVYLFIFFNAITIAVSFNHWDVFIRMIIMEDDSVEIYETLLLSMHHCYYTLIAPVCHVNEYLRRFNPWTTTFIVILCVTDTYDSIVIKLLALHTCPDPLQFKHKELDAF